MRHSIQMQMTLMAVLLGIGHQGFAQGVPQPPPDVVVSDGSGNTAMGTNVLTNSEPALGSMSNTATGQDALYDELAPLLVNEMQRRAVQIHALKMQIEQITELKQQLAEMRAAMLKPTTKESAR